MALGYRQRVRLLVLLGACGVMLLVARLTQLQLLDHHTWAAKAEAESAHWRPVHARRGRILDRHGRVLAQDQSGFDLVVRTAAWEGRLHECDYCGFHYHRYEEESLPTCPRCKRRDAAFVFADQRDVTPLARALRLPPSELIERIEERVAQAEVAVTRLTRGMSESKRKRHLRRLRRDHGWRPRRIAADVSYAVAREVELHPRRNAAFRVRTVHARRILGGKDCVHLLGHVKSAVRRVDAPDGSPYDLDVHLGASGLESRFEVELRGETGWIKILNDPRGGERKVVDRRSPVDGLDLRLTLDRELQARAMAALDGATGAFVVIDARSGAVLAMATTPSYEPDDLAQTLAKWNRLAKAGRGRGTPLINRACDGFLAPGSILKPFTAAAGLTAGVIDLDATISCDGFFRARDGRRLTSALRCDGTHHEVELHRALVKSCNIYFQTVVARLDRGGHYGHFLRAGRRFGFGLPTGIEVERRRFPNTFERPDSWYERVSSAIGQGRVRLTPAQMARGYAALLTGVLPSLHVVVRVGERDVAPQRAPLEIPDAVLAPIRAALREVPRIGTASGHGLETWGLACKTGTAQVVGSVRGRLFNAWMAGFNDARKGRPAIAFAMVVADTHLHGGEECGPRLREFFAAFYGGRSE